MFVAAYTSPRTPIILSFSANLITAFAVLLLGGAAMLHFGAENPSLHTVLDTSVALTGALVALLLWDKPPDGPVSWPLFLAISLPCWRSARSLDVAAVLGWLVRRS